MILRLPSPLGFDLRPDDVTNRVAPVHASGRRHHVRVVSSRGAARWGSLPEALDEVDLQDFVVGQNNGSYRLTDVLVEAHREVPVRYPLVCKLADDGGNAHRMRRAHRHSCGRERLQRTPRA